MNELNSAGCRFICGLRPLLAMPLQDEAAEFTDATAWCGGQLRLKRGGCLGVETLET
jgi:hypothetical protein